MKKKPAGPVGASGPIVAQSKDGAVRRSRKSAISAERASGCRKPRPQAAISVSGVNIW
ncbi:hypothetical protein ACE7GA_08680 [Roseomonas sp. CCTCC AB2023176]|uniref:hypothetical protein n=1 Tax=Roseomonas sp. CCTCC AB2023176 TaxID=3342640 RepID=UPI0035D64F45